MLKENGGHTNPTNKKKGGEEKKSTTNSWIAKKKNKKKPISFFFVQTPLIISFRSFFLSLPRFFQMMRVKPKKKYRNTYEF